MKVNQIALGIVLTSGSMVVHADSIFFPYVVNSSTVTTVVNVIDTAAVGSYYSASGAADPSGNRLHYTLVNKSGADAADNEAACSEVNYFLPHSPFDLQSIDLGGKLSGGADKGVLFSDPGTNNTWRDAVSGDLTYALASAAAGGGDLRGFLIVDNAVTGGSAVSLDGEALVFEFANGAAWGYRAKQQLAAATDNGVEEFDYSSHASSTAIGDGARVSFLPLTETTTRFFVTPLNLGGGDSLHPTTNPNSYGSYTTQLQLRTGSGVAYDRDENLVSGTVPANVTCVGAVDVESLLAPGAATVLANGGWGYLQTTAPTSTPTGDIVHTGNAVVIKIEYNAAGTFNGQPFNGTFNNATEL